MAARRVRQGRRGAGAAAALGGDSAPGVPSRVVALCARLGVTAVVTGPGRQGTAVPCHPGSPGSVPVP